MSEKKRKVIYVKDLVIKAENVRIEQPAPQPRPRPFDPFFGPRREPVFEESVDHKEKIEDIESSSDDHHKGHK
ncbi:hypothetical protein GH741_12030 [Aquibacillus halophilus]|uniref:Uncharacterized protein n=1 Tax=Aquibacillus halophilus TaxID=930132 RepID=A0A6A8DCM5_9BACI|nr:hypothetical protein [Aquibacillus halophilus]MRH43408.1 hypothetical protein [Aquibacillus halophilus]